MSAPNQLQQNAQPGAYYLDQYVESVIPLLSSTNPANTIGVKTRIHREGNLVMITLDWNGVANTGAEALSYASAAGAIPARFISAANAPYGAVVKIDTTPGVKGLAIISIAANGQIVLYPAYKYNGATDLSLPAFVFITQCTFSYFI